MNATACSAGADHEQGAGTGALDHAGARSQLKGLFEVLRRDDPLCPGVEAL